MKYKNNRATVDGETFDSKKEAKRYQELLLCQKAGWISNLRRQVTFQLVPTQKTETKTERAVTYVADFVYTDTQGREIVEDVKSAITKKLPAYIIKRKLMLWIHGVEVRES